MGALACAAPGRPHCRRLARGRRRKQVWPRGMISRGSPYLSNLIYTCASKLSVLVHAVCYGSKLAYKPQNRNPNEVCHDAEIDWARWDTPPLAPSLRGLVYRRTQKRSAVTPRLTFQ